MVLIDFITSFVSNHPITLNVFSLAKTKGKSMRMCGQKEGNVLAMELK